MILGPPTLGRGLKENRGFTPGREVAGKIVEAGRWVSRNRVSERVGIPAWVLRGATVVRVGFKKLPREKGARRIRIVLKH